VVAVEEQPQVDQVGPGFGEVVLCFDPAFLFIVGEIDSVKQLPTHEALVVVRCGIDEVTQDLLGGPTVGTRAAGGVGLDRGELLRRGLQELRQSLSSLDGAHFKTTLARPELFALSATRTTSRCSPGESPGRSRANRSRNESMTPSTD
jgi:Flp pilus assembly secretin CpaC